MNRNVFNEAADSKGLMAASGVNARGWFPIIAFLLLALVGPNDALGFQAPGEAVHRLGVTNAAKPGGFLDAVLFYTVGGGAVMSALGVCLSKNIVRMAVWLFMALGSVALIYFLLAANFLGAIQLIVYAGGTLILLVFGVMLTSKSPWVRFEAKVFEVVIAGVVCAALLVSLVLVLGQSAWDVVAGDVEGVAVVELGRMLITKYLVPFEVAGVLLMIVMVGAAHLARQEN